MHNRNNQPVGFDLVGTPMGTLADSAFVDRCQPSLKLHDIFDGYVFLVPFSKLQGATIDPLFYKGRSWDEALGRQPDPYWFKANRRKEQLLQHRRITPRHRFVMVPC